MPIAGTPLLGRKAARMLWERGWVNYENLAKFLATLMAESDLYSHAWHYNSPIDGGDGSTDWGVCQLNDGNKGGRSPISGSDGLPQPVAGGSKPLAEVQAFARLACDPPRAFNRAREMYNLRGFQPWYASPYYPHDAGTAWKRKFTLATAYCRNMLHEMLGFPLA